MPFESRKSSGAGRGSLAGSWPRYRDNLARHLLGISRDLESRVLRTLGQDLDYRGLRPSFGPFLSLIWDEGRSITAIASDLAISNQACSQLANLVEQAGYLERRANPEDRRSKLVVLTPRGRSLVEDGVRIILDCDTEYAALLGSGAYRRFAGALAALYRGLGLTAQAAPALAARASESIGVLPLVSVQIQRVLMEKTIARGHDGLKMSHGQVLPLIGLEGGRISEMARVQGVSRQAISATTLDLESLGYLRREPDPRDGRGVVVTLTKRGARLIDDSVATVDELESTFREILGERRVGALKRAARDLYEALHLEAGIFEGADGFETTAGETHRRTSTRGERDIEELASRLQGWLGNGDAARLAAELDARRGKTVA